MKQMLTKILMISGALLVSGAFAIAQQQQLPGSTLPQQQQQQQQQPNPGLNSPSMQPQDAMEQQRGNPMMQQMEDREFVHGAIQSGMAEMQLGQLAEQKAASPDVKQFAQKMTQEHAQLNNEIKPIAQQLGVKQPKAISKKCKKLEAKLQGLSGSQFDDAYIKAMMKDHENDLLNFQHEVETTQNPALKQAAQQGEQVIQSHLKLIKQIAKDHGVKA